LFHESFAGPLKVVDAEIVVLASVAVAVGEVAFAGE
jgi:hypothetical protein